jgi:hypothetical protein
METMTTIWQVTRMAAEAARNILAALSSGNPGMALLAILVGLVWFAGVGAIIGSF